MSEAPDRHGSRPSFPAALFQESLAALLRAPKEIVKQALGRIPLMIVSFAGGFILHTYMVAWLNEGFSGTSAYSPYLNINKNMPGAAACFGIVSAFFWSTLFSLFKPGPAKTFKTLASAPGEFFTLLKESGRCGMGALLFSIGTTLFLSANLNILPQVQGLGGILFTLMGLSTPGYLLSSSLFTIWMKAQEKAGKGLNVPFDARISRMIIMGLGLSFLLGAFLPKENHMFASIAIIVTGIILWTPPRNLPARGAPAGMLLFITFGTTAWYLLYEVLTMNCAFADDGGRQEANGNFEAWTKSTGATEVMKTGAFPGGVAAMGPLAPPLAGDEGENPEKAEKIKKMQDEIDHHRKEADYWRQKLNETTDPKIREELTRRILGHEDAASRFNDEITAIKGDGIVHHTTTAMDNLNKQMMADQGKKMAEDFKNKQEENKKILDNLQKMQRDIIFGGAGTEALWKGQGKPGDVNTKIDTLINDLIKNQKVNKADYDKVKKVYFDGKSGKIASESTIPTPHKTFVNAFKEGLNLTGSEIITGKDSEGNTSYKSLALRTLVGAMTGGSSEMVYTPAESLVTMKDYVDKGGNSVIGGFLTAGKDVIKGEIFGRITGKGTQGLQKGAEKVGTVIGKAIEKTLPKASKTMTEGAKKVWETLTKGRTIGAPPKTIPPPKTQIPRKYYKPPARSPETKDAIKQRLNEIKKGQQTQTVEVPKSYNGNAEGTKTITVPSAKAPGLTITKESFTPANQSAGKNMQGMTVKDQKAIEMVSNKYGVKPVMRPTNPDAHEWIQSGKAVPKQEFIKTKTVNNLDSEHLGYPKDYKGCSACKQPNPLPAKQPPDMTDETWKKLKDRHAQRTQEFNDQATKLEHLVDEGKVTWDKKTGMIYDKKTGKPFAGDNDAFAFTDAVTGRPVSPTVNAQINKDLQGLGATQHNEHVGWDYSGQSTKVPPGAPPGAQSPMQTAQGIDQKILKGHAPPQAPVDGRSPGPTEPLVTFDPLNNKWETTWWTGGERAFE